MQIWIKALSTLYSLSKNNRHFEMFNFISWLLFSPQKAFSVFNIHSKEQTIDSLEKRK